MSTRYCPRCRAEVEDAGGYCLLGHYLRLEAPVESLGALRAEVDRALEDARVEVRSALVEVPVGVAAPPPPPLRSDPFAKLRENDRAAGPDPMDEFAPAPRMDWGPERAGLLRKRTRAD